MLDPTQLLKAIAEIDKKFYLPNFLNRSHGAMGTFELFKSQQNRADRLVPSSTYEKSLSSAYDQQVELVSITDVDTDLTGRDLKLECSIAGEESTSALTPVEYRTYRIAFDIDTTVHVNNYVSYIADFEMKMLNNLNKVVREVEEDANAYIATKVNIEPFTNFIGNLQYGALGEVGVDRLATVPDRVNYNDFRSLRGVYEEARYNQRPFNPSLIDCIVPSRQQGTLQSIDMFGASNQFNQENGFNGMSFFLTDSLATSPTIYTQPFINGLMMPSGVLGYMVKRHDLLREIERSSGASAVLSWQKITETDFVRQSNIPILDLPGIFKFKRVCKDGIEGKSLTYVDQYQWEFKLGFVAPDAPVGEFSPIVAFEAE